MNMNPGQYLTIQEERFPDIIEEVQPLLERHWAEIALNQDIIPLAPNYARYAELEAKNKLCIITARCDGAIIGYACFIVDFSLHYSSIIWANSDVIWLAPEHRGAKLGNAILDRAEAELMARGVVMAHILTKVAHPALAALLGSRGYGLVETVHAKVLQRPE